MAAALIWYLLFLSVPSGEPLNCINITYISRHVVLQWEEPVRALQNGQITGYNLSCHSVNPWADTSADLSATQSFSTTNFIIDPVSPFTEYTCSLSAINEVGQGPPTQCTFSTQQAGQKHPCILMYMRVVNILGADFCMFASIITIHTWIYSYWCSFVQPPMDLQKT